MLKIFIFSVLWLSVYRIDRIHGACVCHFKSLLSFYPQHVWRKNQVTFSNLVHFIAVCGKMTLQIQTCTSIVMHFTIFSPKL